MVSKKKKEQLRSATNARWKTLKTVESENVELESEAENVDDIPVDVGDSNNIQELYSDDEYILNESEELESLDSESSDENAFNELEDIEEYFVLQWKNGGDSHFRKAHTGNSKGNLRRIENRKREWNQLAKQDSKLEKITKYFHPVSKDLIKTTSASSSSSSNNAADSLLEAGVKDIDELYENCDESDGQASDLESEYVDENEMEIIVENSGAKVYSTSIRKEFSEDKIREAINKLEIVVINTQNARKEKKNSSISKYDNIRYIAVLRYLEKILQNPKSSKKASSIIADVIFQSSCINSYKSRRIVFWSRFYLKNDFSLPVSKQGQHEKIKSFMLQEENQSMIKEYLASQKIGSVNPMMLKLYVEEKLDFNINISTAARWLKRFNYIHGPHKGTYIDGHEREDVKEYRKKFLEEMEPLTLRMKQYENIDNILVEIPPVLENGEKEVVMVCQDECAFKSNDSAKLIWAKSDQNRIVKKNEGRCYMVSGFFCPCHGIFSVQYLQVGKNADGYWKNADVAKQLAQDTIPKFNQLHPNSVGLFLFDNSTNHHASAPGTAHPSHFISSDNGKNVPRDLKNGWYFKHDANGILEKVEQSFYNGDGSAKGLTRILTERGCFDIDSWNVSKKQQYLAQYPDFKEFTSKCWLEEICYNENQLIKFFPKFHPEFNPIERCWAQAKQFTRKNCTYNYDGLMKNVEQSLKTITTDNSKRYFRGSFRIMDMYRYNNMTPALAERANRVFKHHRSVPHAQLQALENSS